MKTVLNRFYFIFIPLFGIMDVFAGKGPSTGPPAPTAKSAADPTPPPGLLPIDENIFILMIIAVLFGIYIIYNFKFKTKTPA
jgi:hypothetical protein